MSEHKNKTDELLDLVSKLSEEDLSKLPEDKVLEYRKTLNPYGRTIQGSDKYVNLSYIPIQENYMIKFYTTALIGFLNRMNDEWKVPDGVPVVPVYEYLQDPSKIEPSDFIKKSGAPEAKSDYEFNKKWMEKRVIIKEFLEEMFQFNPDEHVRSAYVPNKKDKSREVVKSPAADLAVEHLKKTDPEFKRKEELAQVIGKIKKKKKVIVGKDGKKMVVDVPDTTKQPTEQSTEQSIAAVKKLEKDQKDPTLQDTVYGMIPPHDVFGRFTNYVETNTEEIDEAVLNLYNDKPDYVAAINPYDVHDTMDEADAFKKKHANEVITTIFTLETGKWNVMRSNKAKLKKTEFFNKNTIILEEMVKQAERDAKLGQDLMKKRLEKKKKENIIKDGPDSESFLKWKAQNSNLKDMGVHTNDPNLVDPDCPDDAIQVNIWKVAKGGLELTKDRMFTKAEAPSMGDKK